MQHPNYIIDSGISEKAVFIKMHELQHDVYQKMNEVAGLTKCHVVVAKGLAYGYLNDDKMCSQLWENMQLDEHHAAAVIEDYDHIEALIIKENEDRYESYLEDRLHD